MFAANSGTLAAASGSKYVLPTPIEFPEHFICERIRAEVTAPIKENTGGGNRTFALADLVSLCGSIWSSWSMQFGKATKETVDNALPFARLRELAAVMTQRDGAYVEIPHATGTGTHQFDGELRSATGTYTINSAVETNLHLELHRSFLVERMGSQQNAWCPGATQMRQLALQWTRGAAWTASSGQIVENGAASVTILIEVQPARGADRWVRVVRLYTNETGGLTQTGPDEGGGLISMYEYTAAAASSTMTQFSLSRDGVPIHDNISEDRVTRAAFARLPLGAYDANALVTVLYEQMSAITLEDIPVGGNWQLRQATNVLSPMKTGWVHIPPVTADYRDTIIGPNSITDDDRAESKLVVETAHFGQRLDLAHSSIAPVLILARSDPAFVGSPGRRFARGREPITHIPDDAATPIRQKVEASQTPADVFARAVAGLSAAIPGGGAPAQGQMTGTAASVAQALAPASLKGAADFATGLASRFESIS